jgi:hypothetical protein
MNLSPIVYSGAAITTDPVHQVKATCALPHHYEGEGLHRRDSRKVRKLYCKHVLLSLDSQDKSCIVKGEELHRRESLKVWNLKPAVVC